MANRQDAKKGNVGLSVNLLPTFYQTSANRKFLQATVDQLFQPGSVKKINGYIGRENAKSATGEDIYLAAADRVRQDYQFEPSITIKDSLGNNIFFKDYIDYINQISVFGGISNNHARLNKQEFYSWDPHIDWDKFVNFQNYYWLPYGPETIKIPGQAKSIESTYTVTIESEINNNEYLFTPNGFTRNPVLKLFRGQTYHFDINSPGNPFSIKTERSLGTADRYLNDFVSGYGIETGTLTFTVPLDAPTILYYQSETDVNLGGAFEVLSILEDSYIDVTNELLGKKTYKLPNGTQLSNGMKVSFSGNVTPTEYASGEYFVEGVGISIKLVSTKIVEIINTYTTEETIPFDSDKFDTEPFSDATGFAGQPDYIVINKTSNDYNNWSRYNRWFHKDVIIASASYNKNVASLDQTARAVRPIIEFEANLKLANSGTTAIVDVDIVDDYTSDAFSTIEGTLGYNVDGVPLAQGQRIIFTADSDRLVKNKIFEVQFLDVLHLNAGSRQIHLAEIASPVLNQVTLVKTGKKYQGKSIYYNGSSWVVGQQKTKINQAPLFDIVDSNGISYGDNSVYNGSTFIGTTLFSYKLGSGSNDNHLGFPLSYRNISNIGDIVFNFTLATDSFQYKLNTSVLTQNINVGYLVSQNYSGKTIYKNGWQECTVENTQAAIRVYKNSNLTNNFPIDIFDDISNLSDLTVKIYINGKRLDPLLWSVIDGAYYKTVVLTTPIALTDVLTIRAFSSQPINKTGYYEIPLNLQNNPLNNIMGDFTLGEVIDHVGSIVDNTVAFSGAFPGPGNLRDLGNTTQYGTKFVQHSGPLSNSLYHITSETNNIVRSIEQSRDDFNSFKRNFIKLSSNLGVDGDPVTIVNLIMQKINKDRPNTAPYYFSDMVPYGASIKTNLTVVDHRIKQYPLSALFTLDTLSNKAVGIYLNGVQLIYIQDYTFNEQGFVIIDPSVSMNDGDTITTVEYDSTDGCFVPATPTKFGMWPAYIPKIYTDTTYLTPRVMIQGHDGSQVLAYGDYRDALILELEKRIFNNIKVKYDPTIFDITDIIPSYNRKNDYSLTEFNQVLSPNFYKWTTLSGRDFTKPIGYNVNDPFTFNYSETAAPDGRAVPGYWRGIFQYLLDTDRPNLCPWEMLGFSIEPSWWQDLYGPAPYTGDNLPMWQDISDGLVRAPGKPPVKLSKYAKPFLMQHIPVDSNGRLISPLASGLAYGPITKSTASNFVFGDQSPVETAWRRSSHYPFAVILSSILLTPAKSIGILLDRSRIVRNLTGQLVYKDTNLRIRPADIKLPSIYTSTTRVQTSGIVNYVVDQILNFIFSNNLKSYNRYLTDLVTMTTQLSYRVGAFTSKEQLNLLLDSKTPLSKGNVFVPKENYSVVLNTSSPIKKITYSGVIITKLATGFEVKGYSKTQPYFKYYPYTQSGATVTVGGISEIYAQFAQGQLYTTGSVIEFNGQYFRALVNFTGGSTLDLSAVTILGALPVIGGATATIRKRWDRTDPITVPYGTEFNTAQEVVDFLQGYGRWLQDQGFVFDSFNVNLSQVSNWETSCKEFLFWTTQNWAPAINPSKDWTPANSVEYGSIIRYNGNYYSALYNIPPSEIFDETLYTALDGLSMVGNSVLSLSPAATKLTFTTTLAVVDDIKNQFYKYEIFKVDGTPIAPQFLDSYRSGNVVTYTPRTADGIYSASFYLIQHEQVVTLDNTTIFNDVIYNPESGYRQERIKVAGHVSVDWYGGLDVPGFIFDQATIQEWQSWKDYSLGDIVNYQGFYYSALSALVGTQTFEPTSWTRLENKPTPQLLPNWSYKASQFEDFYNLDSDNFDSNQQKMAQHLIGYQKRQYLDNILQDDVTEFKFFQGMIREKGTQNSLNKLFNVLSSDNLESLVFYEEWALRLGQYGAAKAFENIEFILEESKFRINPQGVELRNLNDVSLDDTFIIQQTKNDVYLKPFGYSSQPWPLLNVYNPYLRSAGYVNSSDVFLSLGYLDELTNQDITTFNEGAYISVSFDGPSWNVYRYTDLQIAITDISYNNVDTLTFTTENLTSLKTGDWIGVSQVTTVQGFYQVASVTLNSFTVNTVIKSFPLPFTQTAQLVVYAFISQRTSSIDNLDTVLVPRTTPGEMIWTDDQGNGKWATWEYNPIYKISYLNNSAPQDRLEFGSVIAINRAGNMSAVGTGFGQITTYDKSSIALPWVQRQIIEPPFISTNSVYLVGASTTIGSTTVSMVSAVSGMIGGIISGQGIPLDTLVTSVTPGVSVTISQKANASSSGTTYTVSTNVNAPNTLATSTAISPDGAYLITGSPLAGNAVTNYLGEYDPYIIYGPGAIVSIINDNTGFTEFYQAVAVAPIGADPSAGNPEYWENIFYVPVSSYGTWDPTVVCPFDSANSTGTTVVYKGNVYESAMTVYGQATIIITNTTATTYYLTTPDTSVLGSGYQITFSGNTFGGITEGVIYYVATIISSTQFTITALQGSALTVPLTTASGEMTATQAAAQAPDSGNGQWTLQYPLVGTVGQGVVSLYKKDSNNIYSLVDTIISPFPTLNENFGSSFAFGNDVIYISAQGYSNNTGRVYKLKYSTIIQVTSAYNPVGSYESILCVTNTSGIRPGMYVLGTGFTSGQIVETVLSSTTVQLSGTPDSTPEGIIEFATIGWGYDQTEIYSGTITGMNFGYSLAISNDNSTLAISAASNVTVALVAIFKASTNLSIATTGASGNGTTATITFTRQNLLPFALGDTITVSGVIPTTFNGAFVVTAVTNSSVSFASRAIGPQTHVGTITGNSLSGFTLTQTLYGIDYDIQLAISDDGQYVAISDDTTNTSQIKQAGSVSVYQNINGNYTFYQSVLPHQPETNGHFGRKISFMNNYSTLVIYSQYGDTFITTTFDSNKTTFDKNSTPFTVRQINSGRVDVYDKYADKWIFSESLTRSNPVTPAGEFVVGNTYSILTLGTTDFTKVGASINAIGVTFTATSDGSGTGVAAIITNESGVADGYGSGFAVGGNHILIGAPFGVDQGLVSGRVYDYGKTPNQQTWTIVHSEIDKPDVKKIRKAFLYNRKLGTLITYLDIIDPAQGKIAGPADEEIKFKAVYDPATYSVGDTTVNVNAGTAWKDDRVGQLWWDLRTAKFLNAYQDNPIYKNTNWNTLAPGASIDVYEWVKYNQLPSQWDSLADTPTGIALGISGTSLYGNTAYSVKQTYNTVTQQFKNTYYFWVKNKQFVPNVPGRNMSAQNVANLIANPRGQAYTYLALTGPSSFSLVNAKQYLKSDEVVLSVEYWLGTKTDQNVHGHWKLISNDPTTYIPLVIEQKWIDSLCGKDSAGRLVPDPSLPPKIRYGVENRPRQGMFVNRFEALKEFVEQANRLLSVNQVVETNNLTNLESYDKAPTISAGIYDVSFDTYAELRFASVGNFSKPSISPSIADGRIVGITINTDNQGNPLAGKGYTVAPFIQITGSGEGAVVRAIINAKGQITGAKVEAAGEGYDNSTIATVRNYSALVLSDENANNKWSVYNWTPSVTTSNGTIVNGFWTLQQTQSYDVRDYWNYLDWYATGYSQFTLSDFSVATLSDLNSIKPVVGETVKVRTSNSSGWVILSKYANSASVDWTQSYKVVGIQNGTIQLSSSLYNTSGTTQGFDNNIYDSSSYDLVAATELRIILDSLKNDIFVGELNGSYLDLFFGSVHYIHSEQPYVDWIFKTSFVRAQHNIGNLDQPVTYKPDNLSNFEDYVNEVKPYKTKVREYISNYDSIDPAQLPITDFDLQPIYEGNKMTFIEAHIQDGKIIAQDTAIETYPWKFWADNVGFIVTELKLIDGGRGYVTEPQVIISGNSGTGATARAFISNEKVNRIVLLTPGSGYLSAPTITINGGTLPTGTPAHVVAVIGKGVVRSNYIGIKFDRVDQKYYMTQIQKVETFTGTGSRLQFPLIWGPDNRIGQSTVTINGILSLRDTYTLNILSNKSKGYTTYSGTITFTTAPVKGALISVTYIVDESLLSATDRIQYYYNTTNGSLGKDLAQLMTGVDYGGVIVNGLGFEISQGWDSVPFYSDKWDTYDSNYTDYNIVVDANTHAFILPYTPSSGIQLNIYKLSTSVDSYVSDGIKTEYQYNIQDYNPYATVTNTTQTQGIYATFTSINSVASSYGIILVVSSTTNIVSGMTVSGAGFSSGQTVVSITNSTTIRLSAPPDSLPNGTLVFSFNVSGSNILRVASVTGVRVGDELSTADKTLSLFASSTTVKSIFGTTLTLSTILYYDIPDATYITFIRKLIQPTDIVITGTGLAKLTNLSNSGIVSGSTINIIGSLNPVRLDDPNYNIAPYFAQLIEASAYDTAFTSNYQSIQAGLAILNHITTYGYKVSETNYSIDELISNITSLTTVASNSAAVTEINTNATIVKTIVSGGIVPQPIFTLSYGTPRRIVYNVPNINTPSDGIHIGPYVYIPVATINATQVTAGWSVSGLGITGFATVTNVVIQNGLVAAQINQSIQLLVESGNYTFISPGYGLYSASTLLNDNIPFIQAELVQYLANNYPTITINLTDFQTRIQYIVLSLCYDLMYGGNRESVYSATQYWVYNNSIPFIQPSSYWSGIFGYLNTMAQNIITNTPFTRLQTHFFQTTIANLVNGGIASTSVSDNIATIKTIISNSFYPNYIIVNPTLTIASAGLQIVANTILSNESSLTPSINPTAIVNTFLSDGVADGAGIVTKTFTIPQPYTVVDGGQANSIIDIEVDDGGSAGTVYSELDKVDAGSNASANVFVVSDGDEFIIRQTTSDGSIALQDQDYDTALDGGDTSTLTGIFATATGLAADDIIVDGDGFVTPTTNVAPEEVVPGQLVDTLAIKVFDKPTTGSAMIKVDNYIGNGTNDTFKVTQQANGPGAIIVKANGLVKTVTTDYDIDFNNSNVVFHVAPAINTQISLFSIGFSGANIIDIDHFIGDGLTREFVTNATWTSPVTALVYVNGTVASPELFKTDVSYSYSNAIGFRFGTAPKPGDLINFIIVAGSTPTYAVTNVETVLTNGSTTYTLQNTVGNSLPTESNMIVRVDQNILSGPNNSYFTIGSNRLNYNIDPTKFVPYSVDITTINVYVGSNTLVLGKDYIVDLGGITIKINKTTYTTYKGQELIVSVITGQGYRFNPLNNQITFSETYDNTHVVQVISSYQHEFLDIQRTTVSASSTASLVANSAQYYYYENILGGVVDLDRPVINDYYVWVVKNNTLLVPIVDYKLNADYQSITLSKNCLSTDKITLITFGSNVLQSGIAYMQFKDMLNRVSYKRLSQAKQTTLAQDLHWNDIDIVVSNASAFDLPNPSKNKPGVVEIRGERIEYFSLVGNTLSRLRRGTLGTGVNTLVVAGSNVQDIGGSETIPYQDTQIVKQIISDGTSTINLDFTPSSVNEIEVFVGGYNDGAVWESGAVYPLGSIVNVGVYTYRCLVSHSSGSTFYSPVTTVTINADGTTTATAINVLSSSVWQFFIGNRRLKKVGYSVFNINNAPASPEGDVNFKADFTVDGTTPQITLTNLLSFGTQVTVVKNTGTTWDNTTNILYDTGKISDFIRSAPGIWYKEYK
jgi:hypothetical protein